VPHGRKRAGRAVLRSVAWASRPCAAPQIRTAIPHCRKRAGRTVLRGMGIPPMCRTAGNGRDAPFYVGQAFLPASPAELFEPIEFYLFFQ